MVSVCVVVVVLNFGFDWPQDLSCFAFPTPPLLFISSVSAHYKTTAVDPASFFHRLDSPFALDPRMGYAFPTLLPPFFSECLSPTEAM